MEWVSEGGMEGWMEGGRDGGMEGDGKGEHCAAPHYVPPRLELPAGSPARADVAPATVPVALAVAATATGAAAAAAAAAGSRRLVPLRACSETCVLIPNRPRLGTAFALPEEGEELETEIANGLYGSRCRGVAGVENGDVMGPAPPPGLVKEGGGKEWAT